VLSPNFANFTVRIRSWHHFFPEWLAALRFISVKKDPTRGPYDLCQGPRSRYPAPLGSYDARGAPMPGAPDGLCRGLLAVCVLERRAQRRDAGRQSKRSGI